MNPAAPVWVSSASSSSSGGRSTLDPNSAAFRPKSALSSGVIRASGSSPTAATVAPATTTPATFTRYIGNPIVSNGYHHSHTNAQVPSPSYAARSNPASNIVASAAAPYSSSSLPPPSGRPSHHHNHHHISQSLYQTTGGRSGSGAPTFYYADAALASATPQPLASFQQPPHHTTAAPSHHGNNNNANLTYSAKANTHWGAAGGPPSNITQTHQHHGTVHYNQHLVQRTPPSTTFHASSENTLSSPQHQAPHPHNSVGVAAAGPNTTSTTLGGGGLLGASPTRTEILLQEDVLFTPSTRGIWSGSAPVATDRALDSALELLMRESAESQQQGLSSSQQSTITAQRQHHEQDTSDSPVAASAAAAVQPFDPSLLESIQGNTTLHSAQAPSTHISIPGTAPWAALLGASSTSSTVQHPPHQRVTDADHVNTVQHLLAQLTRESPTGKQEPQLPVEIKEAVSTLTMHTENPIMATHTPGRSIAVAASVTPPAAIGGSPTSPSSASKGQSCTTKQQVSSTADGSTVNMKPAPRSQRPPQTVQQRPEVDAAASTAPSINTIAETAPHPVQSNALSDGDVTPAAAVVGVDAAAPAAEARWSNRHDVEHFLKGAKETLRHIKILSFSKQYHDEVAKLFQGWAEKGIPAPDDVFGAYYFYVAKKCGMELCMKHNGRGRIPGVGYGGCDFANRGPKFRCRFHHVCLFCKGEDHGWFDEGKCGRYQAFRSELERLQITDAEITGIVDAYDNR